MISQKDIVAETSSEPAAPSCQHPPAAQRVLFSANDYITNDAFEIIGCQNCGLAYTQPEPSPHRIGDYYPQTYYGTARRFVGVVDRLLDGLNGRKARRIARAHKGGTPARVLEIGCGHGLVLEQLRRLGWDTTGTEMSDASSAYAREVLGLNVLVGDLREMALEEESYDVIVLWHVLEHLPDPAGHMREVSRLLRPGGLVVIGVPNFGSTEARLSRSRWFHLDVPRHLTHFTPQTLDTLLSTAGLQATRFSYFSPEHDYFSFTQTGLNMLGLRFNLLYQLIRREGARVFPQGGRGSASASLFGTLIATPLLAALSLILVPVASATKRGSAMIVHARKP